jgi:2-polyprenyl-6-methoxyphenol hydroxylase-like FAD-dependent oxidoreductase
MEINTTCCIVGGGPAGMMLGHLLGRIGIDVTVLEKHADFLRDFRGDTIHPSTMEVLAKTGELHDLLRLPHYKFRTMSADFGGGTTVVADFSHLPVAAPFVAMMPQWDFLDFLAGRSARQANFHLMMRAEARDLIRDGERVVGVTGQGPDGPFSIRATLVVAADGRHSRLRDAAGMQVESFGAPIDVMWFRLSRQDSDSDQALGRMRNGNIVVMLNRGDFWQCAFVVAKGDADAVKARGLPAFRQVVAETTGLGAARAAEITDWEQVKVLDVQVNRLTEWWREGLLFIGDAAHAMSPVGGVGINLAVQDAVAAANVLAGPLRAGQVSGADLAQVPARRLRAVRVTQAVQVRAQKAVIGHLGRESSPPLFFRLLRWLPRLRRLTARFIGLGLDREVPDPIFRAPPG